MRRTARQRLRLRVSGDMNSSFRKMTITSAHRHRLIALALFTFMALAGFAGFHDVQADENNLPVDAQPLNVPISPERAMEMGGDMTAPPSTAPESTTPVPTFKPILRILFSDGDAALSDEAHADILNFVQQFKIRGGRVTLQGYAGAPGSQSSNDRRLSLRRVLAVREAILAEGVSAERLDVRALGGVKDAGPQNRVDILKPGR